MTRPRRAIQNRCPNSVCRSTTPPTSHRPRATNCLLTMRQIDRSTNPPRVERSTCSSTSHLLQARRPPLRLKRLLNRRSEAGGHWARKKPRRQVVRRPSRKIKRGSSQKLDTTASAGTPLSPSERIDRPVGGVDEDVPASISTPTMCLNSSWTTIHPPPI